MTEATARSGERASRFRWVVVALLLGALVINYVDRQMFGVLKPTYLQPELGWSEADYANLVVYFQAAYAFAYIFWGRFVDRAGAKFGLAAAFLVWTLAHIAHAGARAFGHWILVRVALGIGEAGGFPAGIKAVTEWFPKRERALATGIFNAGTNVGAIVTPLLVPFIVIDLGLGWRAAFALVGACTLVWLPLWWILYSRPRQSRWVSPAELAVIESDPADRAPGVSWLRALKARETWAYALGRFLIDPVWWMFLFWLPDFLHRSYGLDLKQFGPPLVAVYLLSDVGSVAGGWLSSRLMRRGRSLNAARKTAMLACALCALPVLFAANVSTIWAAVGVIGLAAAAHQGFSANLYTLPGDVFPRSAVGTVIGIGGAAGGVGGMLFSTFVGQWLESVGGYQIIFIIAGTTYLVALLAVHLIMPSYAPAKV